MPAIITCLLYLAFSNAPLASDTLASNSLLYNGTEYTKPYNIDMGNPFFPVDVNRGDVHYQGNWYKSIQFDYDCEDHVLVMNHPATGRRMQLVPQKLDAFTLEGHSFIRVELPGQEQVFYELKYNGKRQLLIKWQKQLIKNMQEKSLYMLTNRLYVVDGSAMTGISSFSDLLDLLPAEKKLLRQVYREQHLSFRKDPVKAAFVLIKAVESK